jgi:chromate transport protein ChrA
MILIMSRGKGMGMMVVIRMRVVGIVVVGLLVMVIIVMVTHRLQETGGLGLLFSGLLVVVVVVVGRLDHQRGLAIVGVGTTMMRIREGIPTLDPRLEKRILID